MLQGMAYYLEHGSRSTRVQPSWCDRQDCEFMPYRFTATGELPEAWQLYGICNHRRSCRYETGWPNESAPKMEAHQVQPVPYQRPLQVGSIPYNEVRKSQRSRDAIATLIEATVDRNHYKAWMRKRNNGSANPEWLRLLQAATWKDEAIPFDPVTLFWYIDREGTVRSAKQVQYDVTIERRFHRSWTMSRAKQVHPRFIHKQRRIEYSSILYGLQHVPKDAELVFVVESEKTAELMRANAPDLHVVATGGRDLLKAETLTDIAHAHIVLIPDMDVIVDHMNNEKKRKNWIQFAAVHNGVKLECSPHPFSVECWHTWHESAPKPVNDKDDIGDVLQMFHRSDMVGKRAYLENWKKSSESQQ